MQCDRLLADKALSVKIRCLKTLQAKPSLKIETQSTSNCLVIITPSDKGHQLCPICHEPWVKRMQTDASIVVETKPKLLGLGS